MKGSFKEMYLSVCSLLKIVLITIERDPNLKTHLVLELAKGKRKSYARDPKNENYLILVLEEEIMEQIS